MPCRGVALTAEANWMREGATALPVINGRPPFRRQRELVRRVQSDCSIDIDRNSYSVAWQLIGEGVEVVISNGRLRINLAGHEVAVYAETGRRGLREVHRYSKSRFLPKGRPTIFNYPMAIYGGMATSIASLPGELREARLFRWVELRIVS